MFFIFGRGAEEGWGGGEGGQGLSSGFEEIWTLIASICYVYLAYTYDPRYSAAATQAHVLTGTAAPPKPFRCLLCFSPSAWSDLILIWPNLDLSIPESVDEVGHGHDLGVLLVRLRLLAVERVNLWFVEDRRHHKVLENLWWSQGRDSQHQKGNKKRYQGTWGERISRQGTWGRVCVWGDDHEGILWTRLYPRGQQHWLSDKSSYMTILQSSALLLKSDRGGCNGCILYDSIPRGIMQGPADHSPHKNYSMKIKWVCGYCFRRTG